MIYVTLKFKLLKKYAFVIVMKHEKVMPIRSRQKLKLKLFRHLTVNFCIFRAFLASYHP